MTPPIMLLRLIKFPIVLLTTLSAAAGYVMAGFSLDVRFPVFLVSLMMLAAGSAALNQVQDSGFDSKMERTRNRPIPAGQITPFAALRISVLLLTSGSAAMAFIFGILPFLTGILTVFLYNGIYTYMKRISPYAVLPGALIGALPPAIGWSAAGGDIRSVPLAGLMFFFYIWQIPHFWLLLGIRSEEYSRAGYPVITRHISAASFSRIIFTWTAAVLCTGIVLPLFGIFSRNLSMGIILLLTIYVLIRSLSLVRRPPGPGMTGLYNKSFNLINFFALAVIIIIILEKGVLK